MATLGVVIFSADGMKHIAECVESVAWADEILIVHAGPAAVELRETGGSPARLKTVGSLAEAASVCGELETEWILRLWGEERVEPELKDDLQALRRGALQDGDSIYRVPIRSYLLGGWAEGSVSGLSPVPRLYRKGETPAAGWWAETRVARVLPRGWIGDYACSELSRAVDHLQLLSDFWARRLSVVGSPPGSIKVVLSSLRVFLGMLFANGIFSRGLAGIGLSALAGYTVLLSGAKCWEARHVRAPGNAPKQAP